MLKKRVIPIILYKDGRLVKGTNFQKYRETGMPQSAVRIYSSQNADELMIMNISSEIGSSSNFEKLIELAAQECLVPLCAGGGITNIDQIGSLIRRGADKVLINSQNYVNYDLIREAARKFGSQAVTAGIDFRRINKLCIPYSNRGKNREFIAIESHIVSLQENGAGEIFLNSIDNDGMMSGFDLETVDKLEKMISVPLIIGGGAGNFEHLEKALRKKVISGVVCGSIFNFGDNNPIRARSYLKNQDILVRKLK